MKKWMRALGAALTGAAVCSTPALAADAALSAATFHRLSVAAIATYETTTSQLGTTGVRQNLERCYPKAVAARDRVLAASCILQDRFATQVQVGMFPNMPEDYFTFSAFSKRAAMVIGATVPDRLAGSFISSLTSSEDAAIYEHMREVKAKSRAERSLSEAAQ